ncbi:hypothetical protein H0H92_001321 [Tricholoma furcatifolium]|nr:hypothetical protein H0H92_001321 [Tricholoma furcatifolium]
MHPFAGTQSCPRCSKVVYAAEQASLWFLVVLANVANAMTSSGNGSWQEACMICNKRLDSYTLLEHDEMNFGTRDLRHANLPHRDITPEGDRGRSTSPMRTTLSTPPRLGSPLRRYDATGRLVSDTDTGAQRLTALATTSISSSDSSSDSEAPDAEAMDDAPTTPPPTAAPAAAAGTPSNSGRFGPTGIPRTVPITPTRSAPVQGRLPVSGIDSSDASPVPLPVMQTATGTRYGAALANNLTGSPKRQWTASTNPACPRCGKSVFFAEQVKAVGKTFHKNCLRCVECNTGLDSNRLRDHDGDPFHGPQGGGYALLGKAGG